MRKMKNMKVQALDILAQEVQTVLMRKETVTILERAIAMIKARIVKMTKTMKKVKGIVMTKETLGMVITEKVKETVKGRSNT